jgi:hypothetical protein
MDLSTVSEDLLNEITMRNTIKFMRETGFHRWGFVTYRAAYCDNNLWDQYLAALKDNVREHLERSNCEELLLQYIQWTVFDAEVDKSTKNGVRQHFAAWCDENSVEHGVRRRLPRFNYCLYVDQRCLDTLEAHVKAKSNRKVAGLDAPLPPLVAVVIDVNYSPPRWSLSFSCHQNFAPVEGGTGRHIGWEYYDTVYLPLLYDKLHVEGLNDEESYFRPPGIAPGGNPFLDYLE